jgi:hypothetical protein
VAVHPALQPAVQPAVQPPVQPQVAVQGPQSLAPQPLAPQVTSSVQLQMPVGPMRQAGPCGNTLIIKSVTLNVPMMSSPRMD